MNFIYLVPLLPLLGFLINGLFRKSLSKSLVGLIGCGVVLASFIISLIVFFQVKAGQTGVIHLFNFINTASLHVDFAFQVDALSSLFLLIITGVGFLIHVYSTSYMHEEDSKDFAKYFSFLNLFIFSMLLLVLGSNYVIMFIGWEGVGLCSYLLIGYWFKNANYTKAANKAFIMNRIGDLGFLLAVFWLLARLGTVDFHDVFANVSKLTAKDITGITFLLFVGATGKSAQIPLYTWLPDAMAGPTPVSALIHAATMVTAGVYMIVRSNALYSNPGAHAVMELIAIIGLLTSLLAASIALFQNDIKKVLAYSTVSQLGYMFLALGVGAYSTGVFHVMTHAFFKALLFLAAGSVIHAMGGEQDITKMGGLRKKIPVTYFTFLIGVLAISGFPFTSGFISKDEILLSVYNHNELYFYLAVIGAAMTAFYMFRLLTLTFFGSFRGTHEQEHHLHESPKAMTIPLIVLAILSVVGGWVQISPMFGGHPYFSNFLEPVVKTVEPTVSSTTEWSLFIGTIIGLIIIYIFTKKNYAVDKFDGEYKGFKKVLANKWYIDEIYDAIVVKPIRAISDFFNNIVERRGIDGFVNGVGKAVNYGSRQIRWLQSGQVGAYVLLMVIGILILFIVQLFL